MVLTRMKKEKKLLMGATRAMEALPVFDGINVRAWGWEVSGLFIDHETLGLETPEAHCLEEVGAALRGRHYWWYVFWKIDNLTGKWWQFLRAFVEKEEEEEEEELRERQRRKQRVLGPLAQDSEKDARKVEPNKEEEKEPLQEESIKGNSEGIEINVRSKGHNHSNDEFDGCISMSGFDEEPQKETKDERQPPWRCVAERRDTQPMPSRCERDRRRGHRNRSTEEEGVVAVAEREEDDNGQGRATINGTSAATGNLSSAHEMTGEVPLAAAVVSAIAVVEKQERDAQTLLDSEAAVKAEKAAALPVVGTAAHPIFTGGDMRKETEAVRAMELQEGRHWVDLMHPAHFNPKRVNTYLLLLIGLEKIVDSPIRQWDPSGL